MTKREKIIGVVLLTLTLLCLVIYLPKPGGRKARSRAVSKNASQQHRIDKKSAGPAALGADELLAAIKLASKKNDLDLGQDPFKEISAAEASLPEAPESSRFVLAGIIWEREEPVALINDKILKTGDTFDGYTVQAIRQDEVVITKGEEILSLKLFIDTGSNP